MKAQLNIDGQHKVDVAIARLKEFEPQEKPYYLAFSGGKDSIVIKKLAEMAGVQFESHYNHTTVDPPELIYYMRKHHKDINWNMPDETMWQLIPRKKMPPTRMVRYCCEILKERGGEHRVVVTGVRWAESNKRSSRNMFEFFTKSKSKKKLTDLKQSRELIIMSDNDNKRNLIDRCVKKSKISLNPIIDWTDQDVWNFIKGYNLPYCKLYDKGFDRLGCVGCPLARKKQRLFEFNRYPKYYKNYIKAFDRMLQVRLDNDMETQWKNGKEVMKWWLE